MSILHSWAVVHCLSWRKARSTGVRNAPFVGGIFSQSAFCCLYMWTRVAAKLFKYGNLLRFTYPQHMNFASWFTVPSATLSWMFRNAIIKSWLLCTSRNSFVYDSLETLLNFPTVSQPVRLWKDNRQGARSRLRKA